MFSEMLSNIRDEVTEQFLKVRFSKEAEERLANRWAGATENELPELSTGVAGAAEPGRTDGTPIGSESQEPMRPIKRDTPKVGRNAPCPCGSGKKYKKCCGG